MATQFDSNVANAIVIPQTEEKWARIPEVNECTSSFKANSEEAKFIQNLLDSKRIPLSTKPNHLRNLYSFLHPFKKASFQSWFYKARSYHRANDTLKAPSQGVVQASSSSKAPPYVPSVITADLTVNKAPTPFYKKPRVSTSPNAAAAAASVAVDNDDFIEDNKMLDGETIALNDPCATKLPYYITRWQTQDMEDKLTVVVWLLAGAYYWSWTQLATKSVVKFAWPPTLTHKAVSAVYPNDSNKPLREFAMKQTLATMKDNQKSLIWSKMTIPMPVPVVLGHPTICFVEAPTDTLLLGQQYKNFPVCLFDRFICVDLSISSKVFAVKKTTHTEDPFTY